MAAKKNGFTDEQEVYEETETTVETKTTMEQFKSHEKEKMGNGEKMRNLNKRYIYIIIQEERKKLRNTESMLQKEIEIFKTAVSKIKKEYQSKIAKMMIINEEQITVIQEKTRLARDELSMKLKTVTEELEATKQSYKTDIFEKNLKIEDQEKRSKFFENECGLAHEQNKQKLQRIDELNGILEENKIKQQQDQIRIESLDNQLEFKMTLNKEVNETERSEHTISKYIIMAESELQKLMTKMKQSYDTALKDYVDQQKEFYATKVEILIEKTSKSYTSMTIDIQENNKKTTADLVEDSFKELEEFAQLKKDHAELNEQVIQLKKEKARQKVEIADLRKHEIVICKEYHEKAASIFELFIDSTAKVFERRFTEDCHITPEITTYENCILKTEKEWGIQWTEICYDKYLQIIGLKFPLVNELMRSSSAANGDENAKDNSDDEEEVD